MVSHTVLTDIYIGEEYSELIGKVPNINFDFVEDLVRCKVLPPRNLFHPVFTYRVKGKLLFALCWSYCETFSQVTYIHNRPEEREFKGLANYAKPSRRGIL